MTEPLIGVPVKAFGVAKQRLSPRLGASTRSRLGKALARRTIDTLRRTGLDARVVVEEESVERWATDLGYPVVRTPPGLDSAAGRLVEVAGGRPWGIVFADLPLLEESDVLALVDGADTDAVVAPSIDGGTNAILGHSPIDFAYGPGSFARHLHRLRARSPVSVVVRRGLALDLDSPSDLDHAVRMSPWLASQLTDTHS